MGLQIWRTEDIENILWAIQTVIQATTDTIEGSDRSVEYQDGFNQGFETALRYVTTAFEAKPMSSEIWDREHVEDVLLLAQTVMQTVIGLQNRTSLADYNQGFQRGLEAALWCMATSFGISLVSLINNSEPAKVSSRSHTPFWFHEDVAHILAAFKSVMLITPTFSKSFVSPSDYNQGFEDALRCVAQALGLRLLWPQDRPVLAKMAFRSRQDIENNLRTIYETKRTAATTLETNSWSVDYNRGFETALNCLAQALGVSLYSIGESNYED